MLQVHFEAQGQALLKPEAAIDFSADEKVEIVLELDDNWEGTDKIFVLFTGAELPAPRPVELVQGRCVIPADMLDGEHFAFNLIGQYSGKTTISTNSLEIDLVSNAITELDFRPVSVDLLMWLWTLYTSENGESTLPKEIAEMIEEHINKSGIHVSSNDRDTWNGKLELNPTAGIPSNAVQLANPNTLYWEE
ncbi:MAG: hypothetical protein FWC86_02125 [Coriobacteriia bacterium]|nr:hypothetical protein [Coriobacteriia bacterium]